MSNRIFDATKMLQNINDLQHGITNARARRHTCWQQNAIDIFLFSDVCNSPTRSNAYNSRLYFDGFLKSSNGLFGITRIRRNNN
jgi:hypothetical protein